MPGPPPKPPELRQRRNRTSTATHLPAEGAGPRVKAPALPARPPLPGRRRWHPRTLAWWREVWRSPQAGQLLRVDANELLRSAVLEEMFWRNPSPELAAEIRLQRRPFGLTPEDRRRLQWEVEPPAARDSAGPRTRPAGERSAPPAAPAPSEDPRAALRATLRAVK